ncbi:hypothetical protein BDB01DRAFT_719270 [Pilobolus umbonatus]|nr:hypothetical protein BDB01DRAFT_719270 [Pilobolus umbonatus]
MEFASAPFQSLLIQNADKEQLSIFLNQLHQQYLNAVDEKARFGTLQLLLPIFKAHLLRLGDHQQEEECLEQYVQTWILFSLSQESMVSEESVTMLQSTIAHLLGHSFLRYGKTTNFGKSTISMLLGQLVIAMESEPDFVDLKPMEFISSHIEAGKLECTEYWTELTRLIRQSLGNTSSDHISLDLEYCLDLLSRFISELNENQELLSLDHHDTSHDEIYTWIQLIYVIAVSMVPCTHSTIRMKLIQELLPNLLRWQQNTLHKISLDKQIYWCQVRSMIWDRTLQLYALPATNLLRLEIYGLIARFFDFYFGLEDPHASGLQSNDSLSRKYSSYILKRIIDFTHKYPDTIKDRTDNDWTPYFTWKTSESEDYVNHWDDWFLLYDIMHENVIHLVEPVLPRFEVLLNADVLHPSWWILVFYRGFQNDISSVKKGVLEYIFSRENPFILNKMGIEHSFIFGALFKTLDQTALFAVPTQGTLVSPFGEHYRHFMFNLIASFEREEDKVAFLRQMIHHLAHVVSSYAPILYTMEALAEASDVNAWGPDELKSLRYLVDRHRNFNIPATKQFLRKLSIPALVHLGNTATLSFSDIAKTVSSLVNEYPVKNKSNEFKLIRYWLQSKISSDKSIDSLLNALKDRLVKYVCDLKSEEDGDIVPQTLIILLSTFIEHIKDQSISETTFDRLLTLFNALWKNFQSCFEDKINFVKMINIEEDTLLYILNRMGKKYLNKEEDNVVDDDVNDKLLSLTEKILLNEDTLSLDTRTRVIREHYETTVELLKYRSPTVNPNKEMSKPFHIVLLNIIYQAARKYSYYELSCDQSVLSLVYSLPMKRTKEALRESAKWTCVENMIRYASDVKKSTTKSIEFFDPFLVYEEAVEQLENASELCAEAILTSFGPLLAFSWDKTADLLNRCIDLANELMWENAYQSKTFPLLMKAFINSMFQPELLANEALNKEDGPMKKALHLVLKTGDLKPFVVAQTSRKLHEYWSQFTKETDRSMLNYAPEIAKLLVFGPLRDRDDQKIEAAISLKLATSEEQQEAEGSAGIVFSQNDYLVRIDMNDLLLRLDINNPLHKQLANDLIDHLLDCIKDDSLFEFLYNSTAEHRLKLRVCCSILLLIDFAAEDKLNGYLEYIFELMRKETITSVRCYIEWAMIRILRRFPDRLSMFYERLENPEHKPNYVISLLTVTFTLGDSLSDQYAEKYFEDIFVRLMPWLITNHFTVRLFAYCAWQRNWKSCIERGYGKQVEQNKYLKAMGHFMDTYVDCVKFIDKIKAQFYMSKFDPIEDFNVEFIFRQMMAFFNKSFMRVNPKGVERCPFTNPKRIPLYTSVDPTELMDLEETTQVVDNTVNSSSEEVFQKKIMPWEIMLETDMDLTKNLVKKNRKRNQLIVVASLIDRLPNLAGLCRTCEIFNASELVLPSLKMKDDPGFTTVSVASEKWMPMSEVTENDLPAYLQNKKKEGYTLCGLEQTTTSAKLGEYEFPEKCILLLGKERQGVPADLLQMLDVTIEIPQYGITRSLNVHVSGAICIYEYTKQMNWKRKA